MKAELYEIREMRREVAALRDRAAHSCRDAKSAVRMARALDVMREADAILKAEVRKIEDGTLYSSDLARDALGWNLNSVRGRLMIAAQILDGKR